MHIPQSDEERRNQAFIRSNLKMHPPAGKFRFNYQGYWGCDSHCELEIIGNLVIATEVESNQGTSITNMAEHLATRICYHYSLDPQSLIWIEHYPERGHDWNIHPIPESWDLVNFDRGVQTDGTPRFLHPKWKRLEQETVLELKAHFTRQKKSKAKIPWPQKLIDDLSSRTK